MRICINGEDRDISVGLTVSELLIELGLNQQGVAVAVNLEVIPRDGHPNHHLANNDRVEIIKAVGGG